VNDIGNDVDSYINLNGRIGYDKRSSNSFSNNSLPVPQSLSNLHQSSIPPSMQAQQPQEPQHNIQPNPQLTSIQALQPQPQHNTQPNPQLTSMHPILQDTNNNNTTQQQENIKNEKEFDNMLMSEKNND
jgi:hypothetical protein